MLRQNAQIDRGRAVKKSKRLHRISSVTDSVGERTSDDSTITHTLVQHFSNKFGCRNLHLREAILDFARAGERDLPGFDEMDVEKALARCKKPLRLDSCGMCVELFRVAFETRPSEFTSFLQYVSSSETMMSSLESLLLCYGECSILRLFGCVSCRDVVCVVSNVA